MDLEKLKKQIRIDPIKSDNAEFDKRSIPAIVTFIILAVLGITLFFVWKNSSNEKFVVEDVRIATTIFPVYDIANNIRGEDENVLIEQVIPSDVDPREFIPDDRSKDIVSSSDLVFKVGLGFDDWIDELVDTEKTLVVDLSEYVNLIDIQNKEKFLKEICDKNDGEWLGEYGECVGLKKSICAENSGKYNSCASACRHDEETDGCIQLCVQLCKFDYEKLDVGKNPYYWLSSENSKTIANVIYSAISNYEVKLTYILIGNLEQYLLRIDNLNNDLFRKTEGIANQEIYIINDTFDYFFESFQITNVKKIYLTEDMNKNLIKEVVKELKKKEIKTIYKDYFFENEEIENYLKEEGFEILPLDSIGGEEPNLSLMDLYSNNISVVTDNFE